MFVYHHLPMATVEWTAATFRFNHLSKFGQIEHINMFLLVCLFACICLFYKFDWVMCFCFLDDTMYAAGCTTYLGVYVVGKRGGQDGGGH